MNLNELRPRRPVRRASESFSRELGVESGFAELDALLPGGGWPQSALTEILFSQHGVGEMSLLLPALARLSQGERWIALIAPPYVPYAPALARAGVNPSRLLLVHPKNAQDRLWAVEQTLRAGTCAAVLAWPTTVDHKDLRRLQLAAEAGSSWGVLFRPEPIAEASSPAALRLRVALSHAQQVNVSILKRAGGWPVGPVELSIGAASQRVGVKRTTPTTPSVPQAPKVWPRAQRG